jgi:hypothetical protein
MMMMLEHTEAAHVAQTLSHPVEELEALPDEEDMVVTLVEFGCLIVMGKGS